MGDEDWSEFYELFGIDPGVGEYAIDGPGDDYSGSYPSGSDGDGPTDDYTGTYPSGGPALGGPGGGFGMSDLMKFLGIGAGSGMGGIGGTGMTLRDLLGAGAGLWGTLNKNDATKDATKMIQDAIAKAQGEARDILGGASAKLDPFIQTGTKANADLYNMVGKNDLADRYKPLDYAMASSAIPQFKPIKGLTLADVAKLKR